MMHLLQTRVAVQHFTSTLSAYPYGMHLVSNSAGGATTPAADWSTRLSCNVAAGLQVHRDHVTREPMGHTSGGTSGCGMNSSRARAATMGQSVDVDLPKRSLSPRSTCFQASCYRDQARAAGQGAESQQRPCPAFRSTPNSPFMTPHRHHTGPLLLNCSLTSQGFVPLPPQQGHEEQSPSQTNIHPSCSNDTLIQPLSRHSQQAVASSECKHPQSNSPVSIQSLLVTPSGYAPLHTSATPLAHSGSYSSNSPQHNLTCLSTMPRQNALLGSSPSNLLDTDLLDIHCTSFPTPTLYHETPLAASQDFSLPGTEARHAGKALGNCTGEEHVHLQCFQDGPQPKGQVSEALESRSSSMGTQTADGEPFWD